jgi:hypothetical protein
MTPIFILNFRCQLSVVVQVKGEYSLAAALLTAV